MKFFITHTFVDSVTFLHPVIKLSSPDRASLVPRLSDRSESLGTRLRSSLQNISEKSKSKSDIRLKSPSNLDKIQDFGSTATGKNLQKKIDHPCNFFGVCLL